MPTRRRRLRSILLRTAVFLFLGAIVNVAAVMACAVWSSTHFYYEQFPSHDDGPRWLCGIDYGFGMTRTSFVPDNGNWGGDRRPEDELPIPYWSRMRTPPSAEIMNDETMPWCYEHGYGLPMRAGISELCNRKPERAWTVTSGIEILRRIDGSAIPFRDLPLRPIWPGFLINTLFYAVILWLLFGAPFTMRRWLRTKRGLCPKCAYPVGVSEVCTECGDAVRGNRVANTVNGT